MAKYLTIFLVSMVPLIELRGYEELSDELSMRSEFYESHFYTAKEE